MRILVTGGSGFIGSRLTGLLKAEDHLPTIYDKLASQSHPDTVVLGDVRDRLAFETSVKAVDAVFHLAAEHRDDVTPVSLYEDVNVEGARNLVAAAKKNDCKTIIFTSSVAVYPLGLHEPTEQQTPAPFNPYGESKLKAEQVLLNWATETPGSRLVILRPCVVFGEGNRGNVYNLLNQIYRKRFLMVGSGQNRKSMAYVGNVARFLADCLAFPPGIHIYNYADKPDLSVAEMVRVVNDSLGRQTGGTGLRLPYPAGLAAGYAFDLLSKLTGRKLPLSSIRIRKFCADTTVSAERLEKTGFKRPYSLQEALKRTVHFEFKRDGNSQGERSAASN